MSNFISPKLFCQMTGLSSSTVARRLADGTIPSTRVGKRVLIPASFLQKLETKTTGAY